MQMPKAIVMDEWGHLGEVRQWFFSVLLLGQQTDDKAVDWMEWRPLRVGSHVECQECGHSLSEFVQRFLDLQWSDLGPRVWQRWVGPQAPCSEWSLSWGWAWLRSSGTVVLIEELCDWCDQSQNWFWVWLLLQVECQQGDLVPDLQSHELLSRLWACQLSLACQSFPGSERCQMAVWMWDGGLSPNWTHFAQRLALTSQSMWNQCPKFLELGHCWHVCWGYKSHQH